MNSPVTILSTKILSGVQKELLLNAGIGYVEYNAIEIEILDVSIDSNVENAILTSKNAVKAIQNSASKIQHCFCVGDKTKQFLERQGQNVIETAQNAVDLAEIILKKYKDKKFVFFCGNLRREELPFILKKNNILIEEKIVYNTRLISKKDGSIL